MGYSFDDLFKDMIKEWFLQSDQINDVNFISAGAIRDIPYIEYPELNDSQNHNIFTFARTVLRFSRNDNNFNEVAITFSLNDLPNISELSDLEIKKKFAVVFGDEDSVKFMSDPNTANLMDKTSELAIVNMHNHRRGANFSFRDLSIFTMTDNIKIMIIIDNEGHTNSLYRCKNADSKELLHKALIECIPDLQKRLTETPHTSIIDIIKKDEQRNLINSILNNFEDYGIIYTGWTERANSKKISEFLQEKYNQINKPICKNEEFFDLNQQLEKANENIRNLSNILARNDFER